MCALKQETTDIVNELQEYWSQRSKGYSGSNLNELYSDKRDVWLEILLENAPKGKQLKILDIGC
ncbi:MAG: SAM-dependent methyltransferase, partial [Clostridia bacterium]|nr:SAM-dependent methyltransferase [Clostridia bacterium]